MLIPAVLSVCSNRRDVHRDAPILRPLARASSAVALFRYDLGPRRLTRAHLIRPLAVRHAGHAARVDGEPQLCTPQVAPFLYVSDCRSHPSDPLVTATSQVLFAGDVVAEGEEDANADTEHADTESFNSATPAQKRREVSDDGGFRTPGPPPTSSGPVLSFSRWQEAN